jgi:dolichol-phosphate mannosyltransferase
MNTIDVICPVYREEASIAEFHRALVDATSACGREYAFHYIYVVDPSPDQSETILRGFADADSRVNVIVMSRRFGHQAALVAGLDASSGDAVIMLDSDMQHPPSLIPTLVELWRGGADIVQTLRQDNHSISLGKRLTSPLFYRLFHRFSDIGIGSGAADFRLLSRRVADVFREQVREHNPFIRGLVTWVGYKTAFVPFTPAKRVGGRSNYSVSSLTIFALNGLCSFSKLPLRVCIGLGIVFSVLSVVGGVGLVLHYFLSQEPYVPGWASLFAALALATSVNLFFLGVLGEYIGLIFDEVKNRPRYLVARTYGAPAGEAFDAGEVIDRRSADNEMLQRAQRG